MLLIFFQPLCFSLQSFQTPKYVLSSSPEELSTIQLYMGEGQHYDNFIPYVVRKMSHMLYGILHVRKVPQLCEYLLLAGY